MLTIELVLLAISFLFYSVYLFFNVKYRNGKIQEKESVETYPKVSILKPLKNTDDEIEENLESFFLTDYPDYEIIFGVDSIDGPIGKIISILQRKYPEVLTKIVETGIPSTENPKIHKLAIMEKEATGEIYWVTDSNIRVEKNTLKNLMKEYIINGSKIVFSPILGTGSRTVGSVIENLFISFFLSGNVISEWKLFKYAIIVGKSTLIEKKALALFGGFSYFKDCLAEDFSMGETFVRSKFPISTNFVWITNINKTTTIKGFFLRMERWAKLRFRLKKHFYILEVLLNPIMIALIFAVIMRNSIGAVVFGLSVFLKITLESLNFFSLNKMDRKKYPVLLTLPFCIILKDILLFAVYFTPFFSKTVSWRGSKIKIGKHTLINHRQEDLFLKGA